MTRPCRSGNATCQIRGRESTVERMNDHDAPVDERFTAAYWDDRYGTAERIWSGAPNAQLVAEVTDLPPGTALDAGCGEGGDAHWLAGRGWRVTALDVSEVALRRAAAHAPAEAADRIRWQQADFTAWEPDGAVFDLVSAQFLHFPSALRKRVYARLAAAVAPGGTLLIVAHEPSELHTGMGRLPRPRARHVRHRRAARRRARPGGLGGAGHRLPPARRAGGRPGGPDLRRGAARPAALTLSGLPRPAVACRGTPASPPGRRT